MLFIHSPKWQPLSRGISCGCCILLLLVLTSCSVFHHKQAHKPKQVAKGPAPTAQQLIADLQQHFRAVSSFHVLMQVQNAGPASPQQVQIQSANGDVVMPDKVKAQASVVLSGQSVQVNLISVGSSQMITDPITGQWRVITGVLDPRTLTNPNTGIASLISKVQDVSQPAADAANGEACWNIHGNLDAKYLAFLTSGGVPAGTMLQANACVGQSDSLPYHVSLTGQAGPGDTTQTTRTFDLSNYNEQISISLPA